MSRHSRQRTRGVTLVELVVSIVVIAVAGVALSGTLAYLNGTGNTSILQAQAQSIANAYLNEITSKRFVADGVEASRDLYDDIFDYNNIDETVDNFRVRVSVVAGALGAVPAADVRRIDVTVDYDSASSVVASGYRTRYP